MYFREISGVARYLSILLLLLLAIPTWAQDEEESSTFVIESTVFRLKDHFQRPYNLEPGRSWLAVRAVVGDEQTADLKGFDTLSASGIEYPLVGDPIEPLTFPLTHGEATVQFVVFSDPGRNPVAYRIKLIEERDGAKYEYALSGGSWLAGNNATEDELKTEQVAPRANWEWGILVVFPLVAAVLIYWWFGRLLFRRFLFHRHMAVNSAVSLSNLLVILGWLTLAVITPLLYFFPYVVWQQQYWIYLLTCGGYLLLLAIGFSVGLMVTK